MTQSLLPRVAIVWGLRTPFTKAGTAFKKYAAVELAVHSVNGRVEKHSLDPTSTGEKEIGQASQVM
jgi:acetyl-CoA acetyltransferase